MTTNKQYRADHLIAKSLVCVTVIIFGTIGINTGNPYVSLIPGTVTWFFGVNTSAYFLETLLKHEHRHNIF